MRRITTPKGRRISLRQYLALHALHVGAHGDGQDCDSGHFGCAAWNRGPCSNEVEAMIDDENRAEAARSILEEATR